MAKCCDNKNQASPGTPMEWFGNTIGNCLEYAKEAKSKGQGVVGIMCEFTPRELIMAAGAVPVCLCGGSTETIAAAEEYLPANLCPLIKSTYGYHLEKSNPFLEMADLIVAETTCDGKKKMYELMAQQREMYVLELPGKPDDTDAMTHWVSELRKFKTFMEDHFNTEITEAKIEKAIKTMNRERLLRRQLAGLMKSKTPIVTGRELLEFKSTISGICKDFEQYEKALSFYKDKTVVSKNISPVRVLMTGVPVVHGAERVVDIIENNGGLVTAMENCTGLKPIVEDVDENSDDPITALAKKYFHLPCSVMTKNNGRIDLLKQFYREYKPQCIIDLVWQACLTYDVESFFIKQLAENEFGIPYLKIETDYSPSDSARIAMRIEALFEMINQKTSQ